MTETDQSGTCAMSKGFNYCFWAKLLVAIPAIPIIAFMVGMLFADPLMQIVGGVAGAVFAVWLSIKIDRLPLFSGKIVKRNF